MQSFTLEPGEAKLVNIPVQIARLGYWNEETDAFVLAEGKHLFQQQSKS
ncbi:MAG: fibronectin type III-like domain-contianing protein [Cyclobacteriaceae bacterium]